MKTNIATTLTAASVAVLLTAVGCGDESTTESSTTSSTKASSSSSAAASTSVAAEQDYSALLIATEDIAAPGDTFTAQSPTLNPNGAPGVATVFSNTDDTREIGDTILVLPDAASAKAAFENTPLDSAVADAAPLPSQIGDQSVLVTGTSPDGTKAVTLVVFVLKNVFTTIEFDSAVGDSVPPEFALDVATKQAAKIEAGL